MKTIWELEQFLKRGATKDVWFYRDSKGKFFMIADSCSSGPCSSLDNAITDVLEKLQNKQNVKAVCPDCAGTGVFISAYGLTSRCPCGA